MQNKKTGWKVSGVEDGIGCKQSEKLVFICAYREMRSCLSSVRARRDTKISPHGKGPFKCYVTAFFWKLDPPRNPNNVEPYTFMIFFRKI